MSGPDFRKVVHWILLGALVIGWTQGALALDLEGSAPGGSVLERTDLYEQRISGLPAAQERVDIQAQETVSVGPVRARVIPWAWAWIPEIIGGRSRALHPVFELKEGWAEYYNPNWEIRVGNQIFSWGAADQINPTDSWNPRNYEDPINSQKLPITAARIRIHPEAVESMSLEAIATPFFRESRLPVVIPDQGMVSFSRTDSRWLIPLPSEITGSSGFNAPIHYQVTSSTLPDTWQYGLKLRFNEIGNWDFALSAYDGVDPLPRFAVTQEGSTTDPTLPVTVTLHPSYYRQRVFGVDGAGGVSLFGDDIGLRFEAAFIDPDNSRAYEAPAEFVPDLLRDRAIFGVLGADHTFSSRIFGTILYSNFQYIHYSTVGNLERPTSQYAVEGLPNVWPWDDDGMLYLEDRIGSSFKITNALVVSMKYGDFYDNPALQYDWSDNFKTTLAADVFAGNPSGFFGQLYESTRGYLKAEYTF